MKKHIIMLLFVQLLLTCWAQAQNLTDFRLEKKASVSASGSYEGGNSITDITSTGDTLLIATSKGISMTWDNGQNWTNISQKTAFSDMGLSALQSSGGLIYAALSYTKHESEQDLAAGGGLALSTDGGSTWTVEPQSVDDPSDSLIYYGKNKIRALPVTVAVNNLSYDIALTKGAVFTANFAGGLRRSLDRGKTWQRIVLPPDYLYSIKPSDTLSFSLQPVAGAFGKESYLNHRLFSVVSANDSTIFAGTAGGINKSTDGGLSWKRYCHQNNPAITGNFITALAYNSLDGSIWAASWQASDSTEYYGVSYSYDMGLSWKSCLSGEKAHNFGFGRKNNGDIIIMVATDDGVFASKDSGISWTNSPEIYDSSLGLPMSGRAFYSCSSCRASSAEEPYIFLGGSTGLARLACDETTASPFSGRWRIYFSSERIQTGSQSYAFPNPFNPADGPVDIKFKNEGGTFSLRILDFGMNLVRTVYQNSRSGAGEYNYCLWDGKDQSGKLVPNGVYFYNIERSQGSGLYGKIMVIR